MKDNGFMVKDKGKEPKLFQMKVFTKGNGKKIKSMEEEKLHTLMEIHLKDSG